MAKNSLQFNIQKTGVGEPLIWGHGLLASIDSEDAMDLLDWSSFPANRLLIRYDARGHGKTPPSHTPNDYHWNNLAKDQLAIADELGINRYSAGGQSMGCATALYASMLAPGRIDKLILMNPPTGWETRAAQQDFYLKMARIGGLFGGVLLAKIMGRKLDRLLPCWLISAMGDNVSGVLQGLKPLRRKTLNRLFKGVAQTDFPAREELETLKTPTLILAWTDDPSHPLESAIELNRRLPQSTLLVAESYTDVKQWPRLIRDFLSN